LGAQGRDSEHIKALYFDTSAITWVYDQDPDLPGDLARSGRPAVISVLNLLEIAATPEEGRRRGLLSFCLQIALDYRPLDEPRHILSRSLRAYLDDCESFGASVAPDHPCWRLMQRPEIATEEARVVTLAELRSMENGFRGFQRNGRPHLQALPEIDEIRSRFGTPGAFVSAYLANGDFLNDFLDRWFVDRGCPEARGRALEVINEVPNWRACLAAQLHGIYEQGVQTRGFGLKTTAGGVDLLQLTYLPAHEYFVTADGPLLRVATDVASRCPPAAAVHPAELRGRLRL